MILPSLCPACWCLLCKAIVLLGDPRVSFSPQTWFTSGCPRSVVEKCWRLHLVQWKRLVWVPPANESSVPTKLTSLQYMDYFQSRSAYSYVDICMPVQAPTKSTRVRVPAQIDAVWKSCRSLACESSTIFPSVLCHRFRLYRDLESAVRTVVDSVIDRTGLLQSQKKASRPSRWAFHIVETSVCQKRCCQWNLPSWNCEGRPASYVAQSSSDPQIETAVLNTSQLQLQIKPKSEIEHVLHFSPNRICLSQHCADDIRTIFFIARRFSA